MKCLSVKNMLEHACKSKGKELKTLSQSNGRTLPIETNKQRYQSQQKFSQVHPPNMGISLPTGALLS